MIGILSEYATLSLAYVATLAALYVLAIGLVVAVLVRWGEYEDHDR